MDSCTLNTTAAYDFGIFEINGPINSNGRIRWFPLHFRQQDHPCLIYMIERYQWALWLVPKGQNGLIYTQYHCSLSFHYFWSKWACHQQRQNKTTSAPYQTTRSSMFDRYDRTLRVNTWRHFENHIPYATSRYRIETHVDVFGSVGSHYVCSIQY